MTEDKKNSVLIVDDEYMNIIALTDILSSDYTIYAVKDGSDAVEYAEEYVPDVILLDILMPEFDGYQVLAALKGSEKTQNIPVIFVTGLNDPSDEEKGLSLGAGDYITKPFRPAIVKLRINKLLQIMHMLDTIKKLQAETMRGADEKSELKCKSHFVRFHGRLLVVI